MIRVVARKQLVIAGTALRLREVALLLHIGEHFEVDVEHVGFWPHLLTISGRVFVVVAPVGCQLQGNLILIVVVLIVASQADEHG